MEVMDGILKKGGILLAELIHQGNKITSFYNKNTYEVLDCGILYPDEVSSPVLYNTNSMGLTLSRKTGQVGFVITGMRSTKEAQVGDTFYNKAEPVDPLPGFRSTKPMVFAGLYPISHDELEKLKDAIGKLMLTDSSVAIQPESRYIIT